MGIKVQATALGFFGSLRQEGEVFEVPDDYEFNATDWFERVDEEDAPAPKRGARKPAADQTPLV